MADVTEFQVPTNIKWQGTTGVVEYGGGDRNLLVLFYNKPVHNPAKSLAAGRPVFEDTVMVRIAPPGERLNIVERPAKGEDSRRFPLQWQQFQQNKQQTPEGTPIDLLYPDRPAIAATLRANGVHTIEQCAELSANAIENIGMGCQSWVNAAQQILTASNKGVKAVQLRHELEERDREIAHLKRMVEDLKATVQTMRNERLQQADLALQTLVAGAMPRPTHMPGVGFDPQTAMINATGQAIRQPARRRRTRLGE